MIWINAYAIRLCTLSVYARSPRTAVAQQFDRWLRRNPTELSSYKTLLSNAARVDFRVKWAKEKLEKLKVTKTTEDRYSEVNTKLGEYRSFNWIVREEGGQSEDVIAAKNYCMRCLELGAPWVLYDDWTKRAQFLYMVKGRREEMERCWSLKRERTSATDDTAVPTQPSAKRLRDDTQETQNAIVPETENKPQAKAKAKAKTKAKSAPTPKDTEGDDDRNALKAELKSLEACVVRSCEHSTKRCITNMLLSSEGNTGRTSEQRSQHKNRLDEHSRHPQAKAKRGIVRHQNVLGAASTLMSAIESMQEWSWCDGAFKNDLEASIDAARKAVPGFMMRTQTESLQALRKSLTLQELNNACAQDAGVIIKHVFIFIVACSVMRV